MHAEVGDWLVVKSNTEDHHARRGVILGVGEGGAPPYRIKWTDHDREVVFFPGPDAEVLSAAQVAELDRAQRERLADIQASIAAKKS